MKRISTVVVLLMGVILALSAQSTFAQVDVAATGGVNASYTTLRAAFDAINAGSHTGVITIGISGNTTALRRTLLLPSARLAARREQFPVQ
jgi:hypothetical protein